MIPAVSYKTIDSPSTAEYKDRGSRFIAYAYPLPDPAKFKEMLAYLKKLHPKAAHHCFAYRTGIDGTTRSSDDGEPAGTAGKPILGQILSNDVTDIAIIVVRYFGGTLLGTPGLINAYKTVSSLVLQVVPFVQKKVYVRYMVQFDYTMLNEIMRIVKQFDCNVLKKDLSLFYNIEIAIPVSVQNLVIDRLAEMKNVEIQLI